MKKTILFIASWLVCSSVILLAQTNTSEEIAKSTEFTIPAAPAFILLNTTPAQITQPSNVRDFKIDWTLKTYRLSPNIALQAQPIWLLAFDKKPIKKYQQTSGFVKMLSTLDLSLGTIQSDQNSQLAVAAKLNLYRQNDPLLDSKLLEKMDAELASAQQEKQQEIRKLQKQLDTLLNHGDIKAIKEQIETLQNEKIRLTKDQKEKLFAIRNDYLKDNWNTSTIDFAFGKVFVYDKPELDSLHINSAGFGLWLNGCKGLGKHFLLSSMVKYVAMKDTANLASNNLVAGLNLRYGNEQYNFFGELLVDWTIGEFWDFSTGQAIVLRRDEPKLVLAYGGDFKVGRNVLINFGIRTIYTKKWLSKTSFPLPI